MLSVRLLLLLVLLLVLLVVMCWWFGSVWPLLVSHPAG
jgi:hypothetical protein